MNDDNLPQKSPANDTEEQDTVSDRVFDFSDGDIKPVKEVDGQVTHSVNIQIAEALRNPKASVDPNSGLPARKESINKLETSIDPVQPTHRIPRPALEPGTEAPSVKVYSQIHRQTKQAVPVQPDPTTTAQTETISTVQPPPKAPVPQARMAEKSLQEILAKVHRPAPVATIERHQPTMVTSVQQSSTVTSYREPIEQVEASAHDLTKQVPANPPSKSIGSRMNDNFAPPPRSANDIAAAEKLKPMRTYESDVAEIMSHRKTSVTSIAIAESKKETGGESLSTTEPLVRNHSGAKIFMTLLILILVGGGIGGGYYFYRMSPLAQAPMNTPIQQESPGIMPADAYAVIDIDAQSPTDILLKIRTEAEKLQQPGSLKELIISRKNQDGKARSFTQISGPDAVRTMEVNTPDILLRSLSPQWMPGIYSDSRGYKDAFVIMTTDFFQNSFAGMLQWESAMADDLKQYVRSGTILSGKFEDRIVKNKDVRVFRDNTGTVVFLYSFIDNTRVVVAGTEATLAEIVSRLEKQSFVR